MASAQSFHIEVIQTSPELLDIKRMNFHLQPCWQFSGEHLTRDSFKELISWEKLFQWSLSFYSSNLERHRI
jgi:hypothetical protein